MHQIEHCLPEFSQVYKVTPTVYGQKTTGQKTTENANPGQKTTRTKNHRRPNFVVYVEVGLVYNTR